MNFHPTESPLSLFYEVVAGDGNTVWGGENPAEAIKAYRSQPIGTRLLVSGWEGNEPEDMPVGQPLDITELIGAVRGGWVW
jgi:hypothetical protein